MPESFESHIGENTTVTVQFEYTPETEAIIHPVDSAQTGEGALVEDLFVFIAKDDITESLSQHVLDRLETEAHEHMVEIPGFEGTRSALNKLSLGSNVCIHL